MFSPLFSCYTSESFQVAAIGLNPSKHLGKEIAYLEPHLHELKEYDMVNKNFDFILLHFFRIFISIFGRLYGINVCGEGGEYETLTLDCPLFKASIPSLSPFGWFCVEIYFCTIWSQKGS